MRHRKLFLAAIAVLTSVIVGGVALAAHQRSLHLSDTSTIWSTYTSSDGSLTFNYPAGWYVETLDGGRIDLENTAYENRIDSADAIRLEISPPIPISQFTMLGQGSTPLEMAQYAANASSLAGAFFDAAATPGQSSSTSTPVIPTVVSYSVDGRPAAWVSQSFSSMGVEIASMSIYVDVGNESVVSIYASPYLYGGAALLNRYQDTILAIADSLRYSPPATPSSGSVNLPQTFTGTVGGWAMGDITFNYPVDWYTVGFVTAFIQNTQKPLNGQQLQSGEMQAALVDPASNMALIKDWKEVVDCRANPEGVTALAVVQKQLPTTAAQQEQAAQAGITYSQPEPIQINGKDAVVLRLHQAQTDVLLIDIDLGDGNIAGLMAFAPEGEMSRYEATLLEIVGTFSYTPKADCNPPTARPPAIQTEIASQITPSPIPTTFYATAVPSEKIALVSATQTDGWQIFLIDTNGENRQPITHQKGLYSTLEWSPDGTHLAFVIFPSDVLAAMSAYVMNADGSDVQLLADRAEGGRGLSWSPDSQRIALLSSQSGSKQIYTVSVDGSNLRPVTSGMRDVYSMMWSPTGEQIIFNRDDYNIYVTNADGTGEHPLTTSGEDEMPTWSPDGSRIAFASRRAQNRNLGELFIMNADGSQIRQLTEKVAIPTTSTATTVPDSDWYSMQDIIWSPDGRHIAFLVKKMGVVDAFVIDPDGANLHHIDTDLFGGISWSPDSQFVTYSAGQIGEGQTFVANADGTRKYALVNSNPLDQSPSWSPHIR